jgi:hypothetical protein
MKSTWTGVEFDADGAQQTDGGCFIAMESTS